MYKKDLEKSEILQGDIFQNFTYIRWADEENDEVKIPFFVVLTQACDLEQDFKERDKEKYENKKNALIDRMRLGQDIMATSINTYFKEREFQQENLFKALSLRDRQIEVDRERTQQEFENNLDMQKLEFDRLNTQSLIRDRERVSTGEGTGDMDKLLSPSEAALLSVPYGTTRTAAAAQGITPLTTGQLGVEATKTKENALSGIRALNTIESEIRRGGRGLLLLADLPGSLGARTLATARREASDVITRLRTGAALNENEEKFYLKQLPNSFDGDKTIQYKMGLLRTLFSRMSVSQRAVPTTTIQPTQSDANYLKEVQLKTLESNLKIISDTLQNQINQLRAKIASLERKYLELQSTKEDTKYKGGL